MTNAEYEAAKAAGTLAQGLDDASTAAETTNISADTLALSFEELTDKVIYNTLAAGLNEDQQYLLGQSLGEIDAKTIAGRGAMERLRKEYFDGTITLHEYIQKSKELKDAINAIPDRTITITTKFIGSPYDQSGAGYYAPPGENPIAGGSGVWNPGAGNFASSGKSGLQPTPFTPYPGETTNNFNITTTDPIAVAQEIERQQRLKGLQ
jgi:hypothetical protein